MESTGHRVFVDTNVLFSAFYSEPSVPETILELHVPGRIQIVLSGDVITELIRELSRKLPAALQSVEQFLSDDTPEVIRDPTSEEISRAATQVNARDAPIWASVLLSEPEYFVTGDRTFAAEAQKASTEIVVLSPRELVDRLQ